ncbi:hypothetical protein [Chondrinema litorale]|uniref:hypothetical protein n=1 Tax=Chondrinema litorale TaxID=2994555 RepID=UPI002542F9FF|nr:hypothetical protein [Chondrinema litorale]UZR93759.1 hypothetical protein OQ292_18080 [Chondrinema litorale]
MKILIIISSIIGLILTILPSILLFNGTITAGLQKNLMIAGMVFWFISAPFLMKKKNTAE